MNNVDQYIMKKKNEIYLNPGIPKNAIKWTIYHQYLSFIIVKVVGKY